MLADVDWGRFTRVFDGTRPSPFVLEIAQVRQARKDSADAGGAPGLPALPGWTARGSAPRTAAGPGPHGGRRGPRAHRSRRGGGRREFLELGMDSVTTVALRNRVNTATGLQLSARTILEHRSPDALARHLAEELAGDGREDTAADDPAARFTAAFAVGDGTDALDRLAGAARQRDSFTVPSPDDLPRPVRLARSQAGPSCCAS
ncbi:acyl carrier protein [Streptomyces diastatochromogenes]|nr:acyl carrier protein [Streptomyces diastatochromogenes]